jgi:DnaK suppressor protein
MTPEDRKKLKQEIAREIERQKHLIESLMVTSRPVQPDKAIGRLTRMEAIQSKSISEATLNSAREKLVKLETAFKKVEQDEFGICIRCSHPIPLARIMLMPESVLCVACIQSK